MLRALEEKYNANAANPHDVVYKWNVNLALSCGGVVNLDMRHKVKLNSLRDNGVRASNQCLRGNNCSKRRENNGKWSKLTRKHFKERIEVFDSVKALVGVVSDDPCALSKVVQNQADLNKRPAYVNVALANVTHVRIKCLCTSGTKEDTA